MHDIKVSESSYFWALDKIADAWTNDGETTCFRETVRLCEIVSRITIARKR
jgi:hypothetical protein